MATLVKNIIKINNLHGHLLRCSYSAQHSLLQTLSTKPQPAEEEDLLISDSCVKQLHKINSLNENLRVEVEGGGCSGFQYKFTLDSEPKEEDRVFKRENVTVLVDEDSLELIRGSTVDYHTELIQSAFRIIDNPKAAKGCSCGASFELKL